MSKCVVIGGNHHNTLGVVRALGQKGIHPDVILHSDVSLAECYVARSKYIAQAWAFPSCDYILHHLLTHYLHEIEPPVIICTSDGAASMVDLNYRRLNERFKTPGTKEQGRLTRLMNKEVMSNLASETGLRIPKSVTIETEESVTFSVPCIVKPLVSIEGSKADIQVFTTEDELKTFLSSKSRCARVQIQEFIERDFEYQLIGCSLNDGTDVVIPGLSRILRPSKCSNTGFLHYEDLSTISEKHLELCRRFIRKTGYSGLFSMEFLRGKDGIDYFMEINFRNDGNAISVVAAGVNLPFIWYKGSRGQDFREEAHKPITPLYVMPELDDFVQLLKKNVGLITWLKDIHRTTCFMEYDREDKSPFKFRLNEFIWSLIKRNLRH